MDLKLIAFTALGGAAGYGWYRLVGCRTGTCPITSSPTVSTLWGALMGFFVYGGWR